jgi:hypothetical protein
MEIYYLKKTKHFKDGNFVDINVKLKMLQITEDNWIQLETIEEENIKQVFWTKQEDLKS